MNSVPTETPAANAISRVVAASKTLFAEHLQRGQAKTAQPLRLAAFPQPRLRQCYIHAVMRLRNSPTRLISTSMVSPAFMNICGLRPAPTPAGVPVEMMSPGRSVYHRA